MKKRKLKIYWTCCDRGKLQYEYPYRPNHMHRWKWTAWLHGRIQKILDKQQ